MEEISLKETRLLSQTSWQMDLVNFFIRRGIITFIIIICFVIVDLFWSSFPGKITDIDLESLPYLSAIFKGIVLAIIIGLIGYIVKALENTILIHEIQQRELEQLRAEFLPLSSEIIKTQKTLSREIVSLQYGDVEKLNSSIIIKLLERNEPLSDFLIDTLLFKPTNTLTENIIEDFQEAKGEKIAKACCVINDRKFIEIKKENLNKENNLLSYFLRHKDITDENLIVSRIFSFPFVREGNRAIISTEDDDYSMLLYLYMIINYYSGVQTYLHLYNCDIERGSCEFNDYVSLMTASSEQSFDYKIFIAPANKGVSSLLTINNDLMLAQALEQDFKKKLNTFNLSNNINSFHEGHIKIKPSNFKEISQILKQDDKKIILRKKLLEFISELEGKEDYSKAIKAFLL